MSHHALPPARNRRRSYRANLSQCAILVTLVASLLLLAACSGISVPASSSSSSPSNVGVTVSPATATVPSVGTKQFTALVSNTSNVSVTWSASPGTISSTGLYQAPTVTVNTNATLTATSMADPTKSGTASVTVTAGSPLSITTTSLPVASAGNPYSGPLSAAGGKAPYSWTLASGSLPTGIAVLLAGSLSGTTTQTGQFNFAVQVTDSSSPQRTATQSLALTVSSSTGSACGQAPNSARRPATARAVSATSATGAIPGQCFGFNLHPEVFPIGHTAIPWPTIPFGAIRLWATETTWNDLNPANGVYDWTNLDTVLNASAQNGQTDFIYTFGVVPPWASSNPNDQSCVTNNSPAGSCDPPSDLNADGSGTDAYWQNFVTAVVNHAAGQIHTWEIWNEPDILIEWNGTDAQMARMAKDAYTIIHNLDPTALVTTPTPGISSGGQNIQTWLPGYLSSVFNSYGSTYADIVTFHGYADASHGDQPEQEIATVGHVTTAIAPYPSLTSEPLWNTEGSWNTDAGLTDPDMQAAYVARMYLIQWSLGVSRFYWFQYGNVDTGTLTSAGGLNPAGVAYGQVYDWMVGATLTSPCSSSGSVWTCNFTNGSVQEQAVWDASQTCSNGVCTASSYTPSPTYTQCSDLAGNKASITAGSPVAIGAQPILLENQ